MHRKRVRWDRAACSRGWVFGGMGCFPSWWFPEKCFVNLSYIHKIDTKNAEMQYMKMALTIRFRLLPFHQQIQLASLFFFALPVFGWWKSFLFRRLHQFLICWGPSCSDTIAFILLLKVSGFLASVFSFGTWKSWRFLRKFWLVSYISEVGISGATSRGQLYFILSELCSGLT